MPVEGLVASVLGVGIVGAGFFGAEHARAVAALSGARLVAASARTPERLNRFVDQFGGTGYADYHDLIADPAVDAVCIALPNGLHAEAALAAARAGKAILVEKPMASTLADCDAIVGAVRETGVPFMVAHPYRFMRAYQEAMWLTNGCHLIDRLCLLLDDTPKDVRAVVGARFHPQEADDLGIGLIGFEGGAVGVARAIGYSVGARDDWTEVQGTEGALRVNHMDGLFVGRGDRWEPVLPAPSPLLDALVAEWEAFLAHVRGELPSPVSAEYGRLMVATVLAGFASSKSGQVEPV